MTRNITLRAGVYAKSATPSTGNIQVVSQVPSVVIATSQRGYPNQPSGAIATGGSPYLHDRDNTVATYPETAAQPWYIVNQYTTSRGDKTTYTVTDPTAPVNTSKVQCWMFDRYSAFADGAAPYGGNTVCKMDSVQTTGMATPVSASQRYISTWIKVVTINSWHNDACGPPELDNAGHKLINLFSQPQSTILTLESDYGGQTYVGPGHTYNQPPWELAVQYGGSHVGNAGKVIYADTWYQVEALVTKATRNIKVWINGSLMINATLTSDASYTFYQWLEWSNVYGGGRLTYYAEQPSFYPWKLYVNETYCSYVP